MSVPDLLCFAKRLIASWKIVLGGLEHASLPSLMLLMWAFSPSVPQAKTVNPYNDINQKPTLILVLI